MAIKTDPTATLYARAAEKLYGATASAGPAGGTNTKPLFERAREMLYGPGSASEVGGSTYNQVSNSFWLPAIREAKARGDLIGAKRIEAQHRQLLEVGRTVNASPTQLRRASAVLRDARLRPMKRERLTEAEELRMQVKYGENVQAVVKLGYETVGKALEGKPELTEALTPIWGHGELADICAEIGAAMPAAAAAAAAAPPVVPAAPASESEPPRAA